MRNVNVLAEVVKAMSDNERVLAGMSMLDSGESTGQGIKEAAKELLETRDWQDSALILDELLKSTCPEKVVIKLLRTIGRERYFEVLVMLFNGTKVSPEYVPDLVEAFEKNRSAAYPSLFRSLLEGTIKSLEGQRGRQNEN